MQSDDSIAAEWFAIRVKSNREYVTALSLIGKGYEVFLPQRPRPNARDGAAEQTALFPGYLFCRFDAADRLPILMLPGVVHIVGIGNKPVPIDERELESLRVLVRTGLPIDTEEAYTVGQLIRIVRGPLAGADGVVVGLQDKRLVVSITLLQRSVSVVLHQEWLAASEIVTPACNQRVHGEGCPPDTRAEIS